MDEGDAPRFPNSQTRCRGERKRWLCRKTPSFRYPSRMGSRDALFLFRLAEMLGETTFACALEVSSRSQQRFMRDWSEISA